MEENLENYSEITFGEYIKHKGIPEWEIAWNKKMRDLVSDDFDKNLKEKREENIKYWEGKRNAKTSN